MPRTSTLLRRSAAIALAMLVGGCGLFSRGEKEPACPRAQIVAETASVTKFAGGGSQDLSAIAFDGRLEGIEARCSYDKAGVNIELRLQVGATRGPADRTRRVDLDYFVAVMDPEGNIRAKEQFQAPFQFADERSRVSRIEELQQRIPLADRARGAGYQILAGFQLSAEELAYNRSRPRQ